MVSNNKNAYEIRTEILGMAQGFVMSKFDHAKSNWEMSTSRHPETGQLLSTKDAPEYPSSDEVLREAEKLYSFVEDKQEIVRLIKKPPKGGFFHLSVKNWSG